MSSVNNFGFFSSENDDKTCVNTLYKCFSSFISLQWKCVCTKYDAIFCCLPSKINELNQIIWMVKMSAIVYWSAMFEFDCVSPYVVDVDKC